MIVTKTLANGICGQRSGTAVHRLAFILGALVAFAPLSTDAVLPAALQMAGTLDAEPGAVAASLAAFFAGVGVGQLLHGPLLDRYGRRPPLAAGLVVFTIASVGCAFAPDAPTLGWLRFLQGLGGSAGSVAARAVVRDLADGVGGIRLLSRLMLVAGVAPVLAPSLGNLMLDWLGWRAIFIALAWYGVVLLLLVGWALPETLHPAARQRVVWTTLLVRYADLLRDARFRRPAAAGMLPLSGMFAYIAGSPFVLMLEHGMTSADYAMVFSASAAAFVAAAQLAGPLAAQLGAERALLAIQLWLSAVAAGLMLASAAAAPTLLLLLLATAYLAGCGAISPIATTLAMAHQKAAAGTAAAVLGALQFGSGAAMVALLGLLGGSGLAMTAVMAVMATLGLLASRFRSGS